EHERRALYEGAKTNATQLNCWGQEYIRAECEGATFILDCQQITRHDWRPDRRPNCPDYGCLVPLLEQAKWANTWLIEKFVHWLDGGEPMETNVWDNLQSVALVFSAIESSLTGQVVRVQEFLQSAMDRV
ncbi:MAG: Gfo/Idh/MocA family protein, partial [Candidatus Zipacnadales bacterium]